ncbi:hypothetical protein LUZ63_012783 [Rhynchospora breviuscula]|uniref:UBC core domain-containing protein n=1 Tax=Rhynchospora breviuscula TaxID=2022672 RepID=A0A9Q0C7A2_9POAL|nr:hypothetical protein LUZ63_012783 [Rhynchospora breviuscula]
MASSSQASLLLQKQLRIEARLHYSFPLSQLWTCVKSTTSDLMKNDKKCSEGGYFTAIMSFPPDYPNNPPIVRFQSEMWHPNVYPDGKVCISILRPPGDDPNGYELASER